MTVIEINKDIKIEIDDNDDDVCVTYINRATDHWSTDSEEYAYIEKEQVEEVISALQRCAYISTLQRWVNSQIRKGIVGQ